MIIDPSWKSLTKFSYKQDMKYKHLIILLKFVLYTQNQTYKSSNFRNIIKKKKFKK